MTNPGKEATLDIDSGVTFTHKPAGTYPAGAGTRQEGETWGYWHDIQGPRIGARYSNAKDAWIGYQRAVAFVKSLQEG